MSTPPAPQDPPCCRTCGQVLDIRILTEGGEPQYRHPAGCGVVDHRADPVPLSQLPNANPKCDFCAAAKPAWIYVCGSQTTRTNVVTGVRVKGSDYNKQHRAARVRRVDTTPGLDQYWGEQWAACEGCAALIDVRDLMGLLGRVVDHLPSKLTRPNKLAAIRGSLSGMYTNVLATLVPGRFRITPEHPLGVWESAEDNGGAAG